MALHHFVQRDWQNNNGRDESLPKLFLWCTTNRYKFNTQSNVLSHPECNAAWSYRNVCSSDTVSSLITLLIFFGTSLKTIHNQLCGAHIAYKQLQHSRWSPESQLTACLIVACRTTDAPSCRCNRPDEIWYAVQIVELVFLLAAGTVYLQRPLFKIQVWR